MAVSTMVYHEVNVVVVHAGVPVPGISLDRVRMARPAANVQVVSGPGGLSVAYPDERLTVNFDHQRITVTDNSTRGPDLSPVNDTAFAHYQAIGMPLALAFGFNLRFEFDVEGLPAPAPHFTRLIMKHPEAVASALRTESFETGYSFVYRRGVKLWTLRMDPFAGNPARMMAHANIHEDIRPPISADSGPPAPPWMGPQEIAGVGGPEPLLPGVAALKNDMEVQNRAAIETITSLFSLGTD